MSDVIIDGVRYVPAEPVNLVTAKAWPRAQQTDYKKAPPGFEYYGDFRIPAVDEFYIGTSGEAVKCTVITHWSGMSFRILRPRHPVLPPPGFEWTDEYRIAQEGEWFWDAERSRVTGTFYGPSQGARWILRKLPGDPSRGQVLEPRRWVFEEAGILPRLSLMVAGTWWRHIRNETIFRCAEDWLVLDDVEILSLVEQPK